MVAESEVALPEHRLRLTLYVEVEQGAKPQPALESGHLELLVLLRVGRFSLWEVAFGVA